MRIHALRLFNMNLSTRSELCKQIKFNIIMSYDSYMNVVPRRRYCPLTIRVNANDSEGIPTPVDIIYSKQPFAEHCSLPHSDLKQYLKTILSTIIEIYRNVHWNVQWNTVMSMRKLPFEKKRVKIRIFHQMNLWELSGGVLYFQPMVYLLYILRVFICSLLCEFKGFNKYPAIFSTSFCHFAHITA